MVTGTGYVVARLPEAALPTSGALILIGSSIWSALPYPESLR